MYAGMCVCVSVSLNSGKPLTKLIIHQTPVLSSYSPLAAADSQSYSS